MVVVFLVVFYVQFFFFFFLYVLSLIYFLCKWHRVTSVPSINVAYSIRLIFAFKKTNLRGEIELQQLMKKKIALEIELLQKELQSSTKKTFHTEHYCDLA